MGSERPNPGPWRSAMAGGCVCAAPRLCRSLSACILFRRSGHRMDVLSIASAVFGLITVALALYHWQLGSQRTSRAAPLPRMPAGRATGTPIDEAAMPGGAATGPRRTQRSGIFPRVALDAASAASAALLAPTLGLGQRGVYTTAEIDARHPEQRGQGAAE